MRATWSMPLALAALGLSASVARAEGNPFLDEEPSSEAPPARTSAATGKQAEAQVLFDRAIELASAGNFGAACQKLEQSLALYEGLGTRFHLAGCWQKIGRTASAYRLFEVVAGKARDLGQAEREQAARARMQALVPKLYRVRIDVESRGRRTEVTLDDAIVPESDWRRPIPVDSGVHHLRVTAEAKQPWSAELNADTPGTLVAVVVPALTDAEAPKPKLGPAPPPKPAARPRPAPAVAPERSSGSGQRLVALGVGGVGVAALAFGIVEGVGYLKDNDTAKKLCPTSTNCTQSEIKRHGEAVSDAKTERTWAFVGIGAGSATLALATYLYLSASRVAPADERRAGRLEVMPSFDGLGSYGAALCGAF